MRVVNRTAVTIVGAQPYVNWMLTRDADFAKGQIIVAPTKPHGTAYLLPEFHAEEDLREWIEENFSWIFEFQLSAWTEDESAWPVERTLQMFREWFRIDIHSVVVDASDEDIDGVEL
jgi:hypothetical protein